ncbi:MAG: hypothetical protein ACLPXB_15020 [Thiobacillaceae bacterium]
MNEDYDVYIVPYRKWDEEAVSTDELRLVSLFLPEILREMIKQLELDKE